LRGLPYGKGRKPQQFKLYLKEQPMKLLLPALITFAAATATAQDIQLPTAEVRSGFDMLHRSTIRPAKSRAEGVLTSLNESFEGTDGKSKTWLPDGWSRIRTDVSMSADEGWFATTTYTGAPTPSDGKIYMAIFYPMGKPKDEWLVTPTVNIKEGMQLKFDTWFSPAYFFNLENDHFNPNTGEFINREVVSTFQVWAQPEGGEWTMLKDFVDDYMDMSYDEMVPLDYYGLTPEFSLAEFAGKNVRIGFRYKADDGNMIFLDKVRIEYPLLPVSYQAPLNTLYFGFASTLWFPSPYDIALYPVFTPLTWTNKTDIDGARYKWHYADPDTNDESTTSSTDLTAEYHPCYEEDATEYTNYYSAPILEGEAEKYTPALYQDQLDAMKMGGAPTLQAKDSSTGQIEDLKFGLVPFNIGTDGLDNTVAPEYDYGEMSVPIFGYSDRTRQWWTENTLTGEVSESNYTEVTGYLNYLEAPDAPLVVNGLWTLAKGQISPDSEFIAEIFAVNGGKPEQEPIARAVCYGSEAEIEEGGVQYFITVPFDFEQPVILCADNAEAYYIMISGYNDPANITWFSPVHSMFPRLDGVSLGMVRKHTVAGGAERDDIIPMGEFDGDFGKLNVSFAICLDAYYPWLKAEKDEVEIDNSDLVEIALDSYYDAEELTISLSDGSALPDWLSASAEGRYDKAVVTFTASADAPASATVRLSAPGVSELVKVKATAAGISDIIGGDASAVTGIYTPAGFAVEAPEAPGIYIIRHADGSVSKILHK